MRPSWLRRWILIILALALAVLGVLGYRYFFLLRPEGSGPAGPVVPAEPFARTWHTGKVKLLGIGDSITEGFGSSKGFSYFERLVGNPDGDSEDMKGKNLSVVFPGLVSQNLAVGGSTSIDHLRTQLADLEVQPPDVLGLVVMTTGGNDIIHDYGRTPPKEGAMYGASFEEAGPWIANFERRLDAMVERLRDAFPGGCHVFLANIYDPTDGTGSTGSTGLPPWPDALPVLRAYNQIIARCADRHDFVH